MGKIPSSKSAYSVFLTSGSILTCALGILPLTAFWYTLAAGAIGGILGLQRFVTCAITLLLVLLGSCKSPPQESLIDPADAQTVENFLEYMAIHEAGIYTIVGSKPISEFWISYEVSEEQCKADYASLPRKIRSKISFEAFMDHSTRNICLKWREIQDKYLGSDFRIHYNEKGSLGFLVNIPLTMYTLEKYSDDFSKVVGPFDPKQLALEIGQADSGRWAAIVKDHYLLGLLFGFGKKNSRFFAWTREKELSPSFWCSSYDLVGREKRKGVGQPLAKLPLPSFIAYQPIDETLEKFRIARTRILELYQGKDFPELTIRFLKGEASGQFSRRGGIRVKSSEQKEA